jgi:hypothetical protein
MSLFRIILIIQGIAVVVAITGLIYLMPEIKSAVNGAVDRFDHIIEYSRDGS